MSERCKYEPTEDEIREACAHIRAGWSDNEFRSRAGVRSSPWFVPEFFAAAISPKGQLTVET